MKSLHVIILCTTILLGEQAGHMLAYHVHYKLQAPAIIKAWARNIVIKEQD